LDLSARQLEHARELTREAGVEFPLVCASAERTLADASFDIVFCDYGAMTFADPYRTVPEAFRVLRSGGLLAFFGERSDP
jgi:ubiquinone/menaquinone biosynthesis C-methylase UbiE